MSSATVLVAMSGGVDSSMAAALLLEQGYEVIGATMHLWEEQSCKEMHSGTTSDAIEAAREAARALGISHHVVDLRDRFRYSVVEPFITAYTTGSTPNPCVRCNQKIKFGWLAEFGRSLGASKVATGHYARIVEDRQAGGFQLLRGCDGAKDQSYFLYRIPYEQLASILFPLGERTKDAVRHHAQTAGWPAASKPESQDICFIPEQGYEKLIRARRPEAFVPGPILNERGDILGQHRGLPCYTVGQRRGLGIAAKRPYYVLALDPGRNTLLVGHEEELLCSTLDAVDLSWCSAAAPTAPFAAQVQIRYRSPPTGAQITPIDSNRVRIELTERRPGVTPGQSAVIYDDERVLGGGIIVRE